MRQMMDQLDRQAGPEIPRECARLLYEKLPFALISNFAIASGLAGMLWIGGARRDLLLGWILGIVLLAAGRWLLWQRFQRVRRDAFDPGFWARIYAATVLLSGGLLGSAGVLFFQHHLLTLMALAVVLGLMSIGSILMHAAYGPAHLLYMLPVVLPFSLRSIAEMDPTYVTVGAAGLVFLPVNLLLARRIRKDLLESIQLRQHNQALIAELTRQKELAEAAQHRAEQANTAKTRFFAAASHDLRQPVQALELFGAALEQELQGHGSQPLAAKLRAAGQELSDLLNALLDFSKIDSGRVEPVLRDFPMAAMLQRMADDFVPQAQACGLRCRVRSCHAWVRSDPLLLERIVRNFMNNALKYTPKGKILLGCRRAGENLRIEVHDTGIGIAPQQQAEVFNEFVQLGNPERDRHKGLGLGLAIVASLSRLLGHPLTLRSAPGRGSVFAVTVPLGLPTAMPAQEAEGDRSDSRSGHGALVVLVDDDPLIREAARQLLEKWGYRVLAAGSAAHAVDLLQRSGQQADVILADHRLPEGRTGVEAIRAIQAHCGHAVPAAIITGDITPDHLATARASGFPVLSKPLSAAKLRVLVFNLLQF